MAAGSSTQLRCDGNVGVAASCAEGACPASPCSEDRRITRSKKALRSALITLIEEKGFEAITVNDLCSAADLNRGTFYNHFRSKEHLLATFEDEVMADLAQIQTQMEAFNVRDVVAVRLMKRPLPFLVELFDYLRNQGAFLHAVLGPGGDAAFGRACAIRCARTLSKVCSTSSIATILARLLAITWPSTLQRI